MPQTDANLTTPNGTAAWSLSWEQVWAEAASRQAAPAQQAKDHYGAELHGRLDKAQALVLDGHVTLGDGVATVSTADDDKSYRINGTCECPDAQHKASEGHCKHRLAVLLHQRAQQEAAAAAMAGARHGYEAVEIWRCRLVLPAAASGWQLLQAESGGVRRLAGAAAWGLPMTSR